MTGMRLVADVGGTNTRLGVSLDGRLEAASIRSFRNDAFACFEDVLVRYCHENGNTPIGEMVVAVAGPVSNGKARLTNRDWSFDESLLSQKYGGVPCALLNDLAALGQSCAALGADDLDSIVQPSLPTVANGQALVVGVGTGFNVSPVLISAERVENLDVEYGHISLPVNIAEAIDKRLGPVSSGFATIEQVFSGRGFKALHALACGQAEVSSDRQDAGFQDFYARLLALLARSLTLAFLPRCGIFFAGGVARNLLQSSAKAAFSEVYQAPFLLNGMRALPVYAILDDAAALKGCAAYRRQL